MTEHAVVIAGAGPTGLMLAGELALAGVDVAVVERRPNQELSGARALGISSRTIEVLDQRGIADRFLSAGQTAQVTGFAVTRLDISDFPTRHNYGLALRQKHIERILATQGYVARQFARHVSRRAPPGRCARAQDHDGAGCTAPRGPSHPGRARDRGRAPQDGGAAQTNRCGVGDTTRFGLVDALTAWFGPPATA